MTTYYYSILHDARVKLSKEGSYIRLGNKPEFKTVDSSTTVADAMIQNEEISKEEYESERPEGYYENRLKETMKK